MELSVSEYVEGERETTGVGIVQITYRWLKLPNREMRFYLATTLVGMMHTPPRVG